MKRQYGIDEELLRDLTVLWHEYAEEKNDNLTIDAIVLKNNLINFVRKTYIVQDLYEENARLRSISKNCKEDCEVESENARLREIIERAKGIVHCCPSLSLPDCQRILNVLNEANKTGGKT